MTHRSRRLQIPSGVLILPLVLAGFAAWAITTQPLWPSKEVMSPPALPWHVDPARLEAHVRALTPKNAFREFHSPASLGAAANFVRQALASSGGRIDDQWFSVKETEPSRYRNVIASFGPSGERADRIVVGAHYDVYGPYPGADDNASGVAGLIELAALLGQTPKLPCRVDLVAFALEEPPFFGSENMGSAHHAAALRAAGVTVRAMIALEMIGYFSDQPDSQTLPLFLLRPFYPSTGNFIAVVGRPSDWRILRPIKGAMRTAGTLPVFSLSAPTALAGIDWSDHRSYWINDYPAVMVTDTSFYRNQNYHTDKDRPETLDYRRMAAVVESVYQAVQTLAADP